MMSKAFKTVQIQKKYHIEEDGLLGPHTVDCMYRDNAAVVKYPYEARFYGCDVIVGDLDAFILFAPNGKKCRDYKYSMSGTFTYPAGKTAISIMISEGKVIRDRSCRSWAGYPETVLYYTYNGKVGMQLAQYASELPSNVKWAIGGGNLMNFNAVKEGFCEFYVNGKRFNHGDVFRKTAHVGYIIDHLDNVIGVYHPHCLMTHFRKKVLSMGAKLAVFVDGGHIPAMNTETIDHNTSEPQGSMTQFKKMERTNRI